MTLFVFEIDIEPSDNMKRRFGKMLHEPDLVFAEAALKKRLSAGINLSDIDDITIVSVRKKDE